MIEMHVKLFLDHAIVSGIKKDNLIPVIVVHTFQSDVSRIQHELTKYRQQYTILKQKTFVQETRYQMDTVVASMLIHVKTFLERVIVNQEILYVVQLNNV